MKEEIKVYLQYPWRLPDSPYYKYIVETPPKGVIYLNAKKQQGVIVNKKWFLLSNKLKNLARWTITKLGLTIPNVPFLKTTQKMDLVHCAHCLGQNKKPWVADFESPYQLLLSSNITVKSKIATKKILLQKNCKKILPWTENTKKELLELFPEIKNKLEILYPAVPKQEINKKSNKEKITLIYVSRYFWIKGGLVALESLRRLKNKYGVEVIFVCEVPRKIKKKYKDIKITGMIPQRKLFSYLKKSDIFFYPSFVDGFGFSLLEAMSFGLPIVTINTPCSKSSKEIVDEGKTGFVIDFLNYKDNEIYSNCYKIGVAEEDLIEKLLKKAAILIKNAKLRKEMSNNCIKEIENGKFSIKKRNEKLLKIYKEALK